MASLSVADPRRIGRLQIEADAGDDSSVIDPQTLSRLWQRHVDRLLIVARGVGEPAEDAVQEAFLQLARQTRLPDDPLAWLVRVTRNQLLQWQRSGMRRAARERRVSGGPTSADSAAVWLESTQNGIDDHLDAALVTARLQQLPAEVREVIVMHLWGELTFEQIGGIVGRSRSSVHRQYQQGLSQLRCHFETFAEDDSLGNIQ